MAATAFVPLVLFPFLGVLDGKTIAGAYINSTIFLFMGGFIIAVAMEKWRLHKRIALYLITKFGKSPSTIILGFMVASAFISMWISNTATAVMLLPIGLAILRNIEEEVGKEKAKNFSIALMLGIAYACSIGGISTIIGTPPNLVFHRVFEINFPDKQQIAFGEWIVFSLPLSVALLAAAWLLLVKVIYKPDEGILTSINVVKQERANLGRMSFEEKVVLSVFVTAAVLWIFRSDLNFGFLVIPGWSNLLPEKDFIDDGTVAITLALLLFIIPTKQKLESPKILEVAAFRKIPWEIIILFGGGFALAEGFVESGLSGYISNQFAVLTDVPVYLMLLIICLTITFLTELTSNTATSQIILPILASLSVELNVNPVLIMIPAAFSASMAFMMPVATPPNAIVFGSNKLKVHQMARAGIVLNLLGAISISLYIYLIFG